MTDRIILGAVGDISFARQVENMLRQPGASHPFTEAMPCFQDCDILFGNLESVLIPDDFPLEKTSGHPLQSRDFVLDSLRFPGFDVLHIASNHVLDCGWRGLLHTYECVKKIGVQPLGAGPGQAEARALRTVETKGTKVGFLGYLQSGDWTLEGGGGRIAYLKWEDVRDDIRRYRPEVDILVISIHGDIEFQPAPSIPRLRLCRQIAEAGADLILCHHPHVPQGVEKWGNCLIHYSLGNFLFDINGYQLNNSTNVEKSHIFLVEIEGGRIVGWHRRFFKIHAAEGGIPRRLSAAEDLQEEQYYRNLDELLKNPEELRRLWHENSLRRLAKLLPVLAGDAGLDPRLFLKKHGKILFSDMCHEYLDGIMEVAEAEYRKNACLDFEFKYPYAVYND